MLDQVQLTASVLLDGVAYACRELRIGAEHLLNLVIEGMPYWIGRHGSILPRHSRADAMRVLSTRHDSPVSLRASWPIAANHRITRPPLPIAASLNALAALGLAAGEAARSHRGIDQPL